MSRYELQWTPRDPLGEALQSLRLTGTFYCRSELSDPWALRMPSMAGCLWFHILLSGQCEIAGEDFGPATIGPGDFALISKGDGHLLGTTIQESAPCVLDLPHETVSDRYALLRHGGGGSSSILICGIVRFQHHAAREFLSLLPPLLFCGAQSGLQSEWMSSTLQLMAAESFHTNPGAEAVTTRLADVLVIQAIRSCLMRDPAAQRGWIGALQDPQIGRTLASVHRDLSARWTVASMAKEAAMSRSAFSERFVALVRKTPMQFLAALRMGRAREIVMTEPSATIADLSSRLGYNSEASFARAFKRAHGVTPGEARRSLSGTISRPT